MFLSLFVVILVINAEKGHSQFYNGHQMTFGKNRVQYDLSEMQKSDFFWSFFRFNRFDVYYHVNGQDLAEFTGRYAYQEINKIERFFDYSLDRRIIFIVYNKLSDFRQSNIGLISSHSLNNVGGITRIIENKVFLYFDGNHKKFKQQIVSAITEVLLSEMLYGGNVRQRLTNSTFLNLPEWYIKGLISYVSNNWDFEIENRVKDGILSGRFEKFNRLIGDDALYAGHSIWNYLARNYGKSIIPNIIYFTRINKNSNSGFMNVLGRPFKEISWEWLEYYKSLFSEEDSIGELPVDGQIISKRKEPEKIYLQPRISPDASKIAYATNELGRYMIYIYDSETGNHKLIKKGGHRIDQIPDYSYPILEWHPNGEFLSIITEEKGMLLLTYYNINTRETESKEMFYFEKILSFSYSPDGLKLVLSAVKKGQSDIFVHHLTSSSDERITNDPADDSNPMFINNGEQILFSSNRTYENVDEKDNFEISPASGLYIYDYKTKSKELFTLSKTKYINKTFPFEKQNNEYLFLGDNNGIINRYYAAFDSTISFVDTTIHYRFYTNENKLSNYPRNILEQHYNPQINNFADLVYYDGNFNIFTGKIKNISGNQTKDIISTRFRKTLSRQYREEDSLKILAETRMIEEAKKDSINEARRMDNPVSDPGLDQVININSYIFNIERQANPNQPPSTIIINRNSPNEKKQFEIPRARIYQTAFYTNFLVNQIDYGFLNNSYQAYSASAPFYNPGFNGLFKVGTHDLFEDYRVTAGVRFSGNFDSNEFLVSIENLKNRIDQELLFHRQSFKSMSEFSYFKVLSNELLFSLKYPFSQVAALKATVSARIDRRVHMATDIHNLDSVDIYNNWGSLKLEYIFDNTRDLGINLYRGTRYKVFSEWYQSINGDATSMFVVGADFRHYIKIHRTLIWANRFAFSKSFGGSRLIYYLGGVDNWSNFSSRTPTFDYSVPVDPNQNYVFQTLATNMRGFSQNIRNGNSFALINSEIRWPLIKYFANRPLSSEFLNSFQIVGFADIGSAWCGFTPYNSINTYNFETITNGPITVTIDKEKDPFVSGVGFGLRAKLFGYFVRTDWAWGIENGVVLPTVFYLSLTLDF